MVKTSTATPGNQVWRNPLLSATTRPRQCFGRGWECLLCEIFVDDDDKPIVYGVRASTRRISNCFGVWKKQFIITRILHISYEKKDGTVERRIWPVGILFSGVLLHDGRDWWRRRTSELYAKRTDLFIVWPYPGRRRRRMNDLTGTLHGSLRI